MVTTNPIMSLSNGNYSMFLVANNAPIIHENGVFALEHGTEYQVVLINHHEDKRANAKISIDGKLIGNMRLSCDSMTSIERPTDDKKARKLTFFAVDSEEGRAGNLSTSNVDLGKISVEIETEKIPEFIPNTMFTTTPFSSGDDISWDDIDGGYGYIDYRGAGPDEGAGASEGGTALGEKSKQRFRTVAPMSVERTKTVIEGKMVLKVPPKVVPL